MPSRLNKAIHLLHWRNVAAVLLNHNACRCKRQCLNTVKYAQILACREHRIGFSTDQLFKTGLLRVFHCFGTEASGRMGKQIYNIDGVRVCSTFFAASYGMNLGNLSQLVSSSQRGIKTIQHGNVGKHVWIHLMFCSLIILCAIQHTHTYC